MEFFIRRKVFRKMRKQKKKTKNKRKGSCIRNVLHFEVDGDERPASTCISNDEESGRAVCAALKVIGIQSLARAWMGRERT
jgi:hypothetical protein